MTLRSILFSLTLLLACSEDATTLPVDGGSRPAERLDSSTMHAAPDAFVPAALDAGVDSARPAVRVPPDVAAPTVTGPIPGTPNLASELDLASFGYIEQEFFIEGTASSYAPVGELGLDGKWAAERAGEAHYKTRVLVRRPVDPGRFNGTVLVEWLNVTTFLDIPVGFIYGHEELLRGGYAYVGVSVQQQGMETVQLTDPIRYASLAHPGDTFAYDIFAQAGVAVGWPSDIAPLGPLHAQRMIAYGMSQSAMRMITFANAVQPLTNVYDAIYIHSRAGWGSPVGDESNPLLGDGNPVQVRTDLRVPVLQLLSETEVMFPIVNTVGARQPDAERIRTWEVAGAAHADVILAGFSFDLACGGTVINTGDMHAVVKAGIRGLHRWLTEGVALPHGEPMTLAADGTIARDANGDALSGVRTPAVDAPIATVSGVSLNGNPACIFLGATAPFSEQKLLMLYPTHADYVKKVRAVAQDARVKGFILPEEELTFVARAEAAPIPR